jgi:AraC family transcriptional regulator, transcriptional activator of pobA
VQRTAFHFTPDVDGPVITATQKVLESLAALLMPELLATIRTPRVIELPADGQPLEPLMPLFQAIERESRTHHSGQTAAGMALLTALMVQVARLAGPAANGTRAARPLVCASSARSDSSRPCWTAITGSTARCSPTPMPWA